MNDYDVLFLCGILSLFLSTWGMILSAQSGLGHLCLMFLIGVLVSFLIIKIGVEEDILN